MLSIAIKIYNAIVKYGSRAWDAIKAGAYSVYSAAKAAWEAGYWAFTKWLASNASALYAIYDALRAAALID